MHVHKEILEQRKMFVANYITEEEIQQYDKQWGILEKGTDVFKPTQLAIEEDIIHSDVKSRQIISDLPHFTKHHVGLTLINLFILDLLGRKTQTAKIFQTKYETDFEKAYAIQYYWKIIAMLLLLSINGFFVYYILLKAFVKGYSWQYQYMWSYIFQLLNDVLFSETLGK